MKSSTDNNRESKAHTFDAKTGSSTMVVSLLPNGKIMIQDYSGNDSRHELIYRLQKMGVNTETISESLCG